MELKHSSITALAMRGFLIVICSLLSACFPVEDVTSPVLVVGYQPVYGSEDAGTIKLLDPRQITNPGKIYVYGPYLLVNEIGQGIHIFDNANPQSPQPVAFVQMLGNSEMAVRNDILYADHRGNLLALRIQNNFEKIEEAGKLQLNEWDRGLPPPRQHYFACADPSKGLVVSWQKVELKSPDCYAY